MNIACVSTLILCLYYYFPIQQNVAAEKESVSYITMVTTNSLSAGGCSLSLASGMQWDFSRIKKRKEMIILSIVMNGEIKALNGVFTGTLYRPSRWIIVLQGPGKRFLLLDEDFIQKSAYTLMFSVTYVTITLNQSPENCVANNSLVNFENTVRHFILDELIDTTDETDHVFEVCNKHYFDDGTGYGEIYHVCCRNTSNGMSCELYDYDKYVTALKAIVLVVTCVLSTFFPFLIRNAYFRKQIVTIYRFEVKEGAVQPVMITKDKEVMYINSHRIGNKFDYLKKQFENFKSGVAYYGQVRHVFLRVEGHRTIRDTVACPISFTTFLWDLETICRPLKTILKTDPYLNFVYKAFRKLVLLLLLTSPLTCVFFYYNRNVKELLEYEQAVADRRNIVSNSDFCYNVIIIALWVTAIASIVMYILAISVPENDVQHANAVILTCLEETKKSSLLERFVPLVRITYLWRCLLGTGPCGWKKILTTLCAILLLPVLLISYTVLLICIIHSFFNLTFRLVYGFVHATQTPKGEQAGLESQLTYRCKIYGLSWTITLNVYAWVFCFLCVPFYLKCIVYTLLGFLLNFDDMLKYFTTLSLTIFVVYDGTHHVASWYRKYFKFVCANLYERLVEQMRNIAREIYHLNDERKPVNCRTLTHEIIMVSPDNLGDDANALDLRQNGDGQIKMRTPRALLFIDINRNKCYTSISNALFEKMVKLPHALCPGEIHVLYMKKLAQFIITTVTVLNLVFVVFFLVDQSDNYTIDGVQTLAAIGSGFLLFAIRRFIFMERSQNFEEGNKEMLTHLSHQRFQDCPEDWTVVDIDITDVTEEKNDNKNLGIDETAHFSESFTVHNKEV